MIKNLKKNIYIYKTKSHLKLTQHCKSTVFQQFFFNLNNQPQESTARFTDTKMAPGKNLLHLPPLSLPLSRLSYF